MIACELKDIIAADTNHIKFIVLYNNSTERKRYVI